MYSLERCRFAKKEVEWLVEVNANLRANGDVKGGLLVVQECGGLCDDEEDK